MLVLFVCAAGGLQRCGGNLQPAPCHGVAQVSVGLREGAHSFPLGPHQSSIPRQPHVRPPVHSFQWAANLETSSLPRGTLDLDCCVLSCFVIYYFRA